jgi:hypothetical protein
MKPGANATEKHLQIAGTLLIAGLLVEAICLLWARPISFVIFVAVGGILIFAGVVVFFFALVSAPHVRD